MRSIPTEDDERTGGSRTFAAKIAELEEDCKEVLQYIGGPDFRLFREDAQTILEIIAAWRAEKTRADDEANEAMRVIAKLNSGAELQEIMRINNALVAENKRWKLRAPLAALNASRARDKGDAPTLFIDEPEHGCCHEVGVYQRINGSQVLIAEFTDKEDAEKYLASRAALNAPDDKDGG
jgi:hypothetical protein